MTKQLKTYRAHGRTITGTSGFSNHWPGSAEDVARTLDQVFADFPDAIVLDGDDDWYAPRCNRPERFPEVFDFKPLALFHSKGSGISVSGVVVTREILERIEREFPTKVWKWIRHEDVTGRQLRDCVQVYEAPVGV